MHLFIWNNQGDTTCDGWVYNPSGSYGVHEGTEYKFVNPATDGFSYIPYTYPHPLRLSS